MKGTIRTLEVCSICKCPFQSVKDPLTKDVIDLKCPIHSTRPQKVYIDAREFGINKLYRSKEGRLFDSITYARRQLEIMRRKWDIHEFDPSEWDASLQKEYIFKEEVERWYMNFLSHTSSSYNKSCRAEMKNHILLSFGTMDVRDIRTKHITDFRTLLENKPVLRPIKSALQGKCLEPKAIKNILGTVKTFLNFLFNEEIITVLPKFPTIVVPEKAAGWINQETQIAIINDIKEEHRLIFRTYREASCRPSEVCALKKKDIMAVVGEITIAGAFDRRGHYKPRKNSKVLYRGISLELWHELHAHAKDKLPEAWLFQDKNGFPYSADRLYDIWIRSCKKLGIKISLYAGIRRSRASQKRLEMEKQIAETISKELGNTAEIAMKHYARQRNEMIESVREVSVGENSNVQPIEKKGKNGRLGRYRTNTQL